MRKLGKIIINKNKLYLMKDSMKSKGQYDLFVDFSFYIY